MTCDKCGAPSGQYDLCKTHRLSQYDDDTARADGGSTDDVTVECTADGCGTTYQHPSTDKCPDCGSRRRRYVGDDTDDQNSHASRVAAQLAMADDSEVSDR